MPEINGLRSLGHIDFERYAQSEPVQIGPLTVTRWFPAWWGISPWAPSFWRVEVRGDA